MQKVTRPARNYYDSESSTGGKGNGVITLDVPGLSEERLDVRTSQSLIFALRCDFDVWGKSSGRDQRLQEDPPTQCALVIPEAHRRGAQG